MNIINIVNNKIQSDVKNIYINDYSKINNIKKEEDLNLIYIPKNSSLDLMFNYQDNINQNIIIYIDNNSNVNIIEIKDGLNITGNIRYIINDDSNLIVNQICNIKNIDQNINIELNGINSRIEYYFSTISNNTKKYKINVYHNNINTKSTIYSRGISLNQSTLEFDINGYIKKGSMNTCLNQDSKIIMLQDNKSVIKPNLYIDEDKVEAKHSAVVGRFSEEELFYLRSRGLDYNTAINLLVKGFLLGKLNINDEIRYKILKIINSYGGEKYEYKK
jgi:Fe-S cluster assembly scaffold protein SufB